MTPAASPSPGRVCSLFPGSFLSRWGGFRSAHVLVVLACVFCFCLLCAGCAGVVRWSSGVYNVEMLPLGAVSF